MSYPFSDFETSDGRDIAANLKARVRAAETATGPKGETIDNLRGNTRKPVLIRAGVRELGGGRYDAWVSDLSQSGFRLKLLCTLDMTRPLLLLLPGLKPLKARVEWREGDFYGCSFERPLHIAVLDHISRQFTA